MIPNGRVSLLLFLPILLCFADPGNDIYCVQRMEFAPGQSFTKEDALKALKEKFPTLEDFKKKMKEGTKFDDGLMEKIETLSFGSKAYKIICHGGCCMKEKVAKKRSDSPLIWDCKKMDYCKHSINDLLISCTLDMCNNKDNVIDEKLIEETIPDHEKNRFLYFYRLCLELYPDAKNFFIEGLKEEKDEKLKKWMEELLLEASGGNGGEKPDNAESSQQNNARKFFYGILVCAWIAFVFA